MSLSDKFSFKAIARTIAKLASGAEAEPRLSQFGSLSVANVEPDGVDLTRAGRRFHLGNSAAITGIANATALVTTAAQFALYNDEAPGGKTFFFEKIGMYLTSGTPGAGGVLLGALFRLPVVAAPGTLYAGTKVTNANPASSRGSKMSVKASITISEPAAPNWFQIAINDSPNVGAFPGSGNFMSAPLRGSIALPPGYGLGLAVIGLAGTNPLWAPVAEWVELETDNE